jgi:hypothetical protein
MRARDVEQGDQPSENSESGPAVHYERAEYQSNFSFFRDVDTVWDG